MRKDVQRRTPDADKVDDDIAREAFLEAGSSLDGDRQLGVPEPVRPL